MTKEQFELYKKIENEIEDIKSVIILTKKLNLMQMNKKDKKM